MRTWTTSELTADLEHRLRAHQWLVVREVTLRPTTLQRADLLAMRRKLSEQPALIVELKTSRADLLADLRAQKWRGYLADGAVAFAFPAGLAEPREIPAEAGVLVRIAQGWSWRRGIKWEQAPRPTSYLYRRLALSAWDQSAARLREDLTPRAADLWTVAQRARSAQGRRLAMIAKDIDLWTKIVTDKQAEHQRMYEDMQEYRREIAELRAERRALGRAA